MFRIVYEVGKEQGTAAYVLSTYFKLGTNGVWIAVALSVLVEAIIISSYFRLGRWKEKEIW